MSVININVTGDMISGNYGKTLFVVKYDHKRYSAMKELQRKSFSCSNIKEYDDLFKQFESLTNVSLCELMDTKTPYIAVNEMTGEFYLKNGRFVTNIPIPKSIVDRIIESAEKNIDFTPIIKMWVRFLRNPKLRSLNEKGRIEFSERFAEYVNNFYTNPDRVQQLVDKGYSEEVAVKYSTVRDVSITQEGLLCTHKVIREVEESYSTHVRRIDETTGLEVSTAINEHRTFIPEVMGHNGDAFYCEGPNGFKERSHYVKVGCVHRLPDWSYVNTDDNVSCVKGLHVGGLNYIKGYQHTGNETVDCLLDPMHIGAIVTNPDGDGAIRCLQYFVHGAWNGTNGSIYHSSTYAALTDAEWESIVDEAVTYFINSRIEDTRKVDSRIEIKQHECKPLPKRDSIGRFIKQS